MSYPDCLEGFYLFFYLKLQRFLHCNCLCMFKALSSCSREKCQFWFFNNFHLLLRYNWAQTICLYFSLHSSRTNIYFNVPYIVVVMVNFMSTWLHHGVPRINIISRCICDGVGISGFSKLNSPPQCGWATSKLLRVTIEREAEDGRIHPFFFSPAYSRWDASPLLPLDWDLHHRLPWFSGLWARAGITALASLDLQFADKRSSDLSGFIITWANSS